MKTLMRLQVVALALIVQLATGCQTDSTPEHGPYKPVTYSGGLERTSTVVYLDESLKRSISLENEQASYTPEGRLNVRLSLRNMAERNATIQVQAVFKDPKGHVRDDAGAWETIILNPNSMETFSATALNEQLTHYTVRVRLSR